MYRSVSVSGFVSSDAVWHVGEDYPPLPGPNLYWKASLELPLTRQCVKQVQKRQCYLVTVLPVRLLSVMSPAGPLLVLIVLALVTCGFVMFYRGSAWTSFLQMMFAPYPEYYLVVAAFVTFMGMLSYIWEVSH